LAFKRQFTDYVKKLQIVLMRANAEMRDAREPEDRQMAILYGKQGELIEEWFIDLKRPGTQAGIITAASVIIAAGCFYFARLPDYDAETG
jgi:hypothetical protein